MTTDATATRGSAQRENARKLAGKIAAMTAAERQALADRLPAVVNPTGHVLTVNNTVFLYMQSDRTDLTMVAGFRQWLKASRAVRKGEKSIGYIHVPIGPGKKRQEEAAKNGEQTDARVFFKLVPVFDVSQTDELETGEGSR